MDELKTDNKEHTGSTNSSNSNSNDPKTPCNGCGRLCWKRDCPFKNATCHGCKKRPY